MATILVTPGCKDRISANVGRLLASTMVERGVGESEISGAFHIALGIEERLTKELQIAPSDPQARF